MAGVLLALRCLRMWLLSAWIRETGLDSQLRIQCAAAAAAVSSSSNTNRSWLLVAGEGILETQSDSSPGPGTTQPLQIQTTNKPRQYQTGRPNMRRLSKCHLLPPDPHQATPDNPTSVMEI